MGRTSQSRSKRVARASPADAGRVGAAAALAFPVVGLGAASESVASLELFFRNLPGDSGAAYVIVAPIEPKQLNKVLKSLQRAALIPVQRAQHGMPLLPDHCYVCPPACDLSIVQGELALQPAGSGHCGAIDLFLGSLAHDQQERALGVILSGSGHDGTLGALAIKEAAGAVFVVAPGTVRSDSMARSVVDAGLADVVAPVEELPRRILAYSEHMPCFGRWASEDATQSALERVYVLLRAQTGHDFFYYKRSTIQRRVERRMGLHQLDTMEEYATFLRDNAEEIELLFRELLIGVTSFFRDPMAWKSLRDQVLPRLISSHTGGGPLRAWVAGCSTGEEAYSLAITFCELLEQVEAPPELRLQIFATDIDGEAIEKARAGVYPESIATHVSAERLRRFFVREERGYRVSPALRELIVFAPHNMIMDPPFTRLDLICCRNFLIYLSAGLQKKLLPVFHYCLKPNAALFLGGAETVGSYTKLFRAIDHVGRIYRSVLQPAAMRPFELQCALQLAAGGPPLQPELPLLSSGFMASMSSERTADRKRFAPHSSSCEAEPARIAELERALLCAREELQTTREELQTSTAELKSRNHDMQLLNHELQRKNDRLTLSYDELRSVNEELRAINQELQSRLYEAEVVVIKAG